MSAYSQFSPTAGPGPYSASGTWLGQPFRHSNFPLMDLPPELRCMVYEQVDFETKLHTLTRGQAALFNTAWPANPTGGPSSIELIRPSIPFALLCTCRLVNAEATPIFRKKLVELKKIPLNFQVDYAALIGLTAPSGPLAGCFSRHKPYVILSATGNRALDEFTNRCGPFISRKPAHDRSDAHAPISVCITITQPHENVSRNLTIAAFQGVRDLRGFSQKFVCEVLYHQEKMFSPSAEGSYPTGPTMRIKGLQTHMWDWQLRKLEAMRQKARLREEPMGRYITGPRQKKEADELRRKEDEAHLRYFQSRSSNGLYGPYPDFRKL